MAIKVLRLIEYTYKDEERMTSDMLRWTYSHTDMSMEMRSAVLQPESVVWEKLGENTPYGMDEL